MVAKRRLWMFAAVMGLAACGGGGSLDGSTDNNGGGNGGGDTVEYSIDSTVYQCANINLDSIDGCQQTATISETEPGLVRIVLTAGEGGTVANRLITVTADKGALSPADGRVLTNSAGQAFIRLLADGDDGIVEMTATAASVDGTPSDTSFVTINEFTLDLSLTSSLGSGQLADGATLPLVAAVTSDGQPLAVAATVNFSSTCATAGKAKLDSEVQINLATGQAVATYSPDGCTQTDTITASVTLGGKSASDSLEVAIADTATGGLEFVSASPNYICLTGSGCGSVSVVSFKVTDENGRAKQGVDVDFELLSAAGDVALSVPSARSDSNGEVRTRVSAGTVPGSVRVQATVADSAPMITTVSSSLSIGTGLPDANSFSLSFSELNPARAGSTDGIKVTVTLRAADHFNNPVPDGTAISFVAEGGAIEPSCTTTNGACSVTWTSQAPRPADLRATVMAFAQGEESFTDMNGTGLYDPGEFFIDRDLNGVYSVSDRVPDYSEAYIDANENGTRGATEEFIDRNSDGQFNAANGLYNGLLCTPGAGSEVGTAPTTGCVDELVDLYAQGTIVMTGSGAIGAYICGDANCTYAGRTNVGSATTTLCIYEPVNAAGGMTFNPLGIGSTVSFKEDDSMELKSAASLSQSNTNAAAYSSGAIIPDFTDRCPATSQFGFTVAGSGNVLVAVKEEGMNEVTFNVSVP